MNRLDTLHCFCLFLGHARTGRGIVGNLLDAHPNAIVCNSCQSVGRVLDGTLDRRALFRRIVLSSLTRAQQQRRSFVKLNRGVYPYRIEGQIKSDNDIFVLGDCGVSSARSFGKLGTARARERLDKFKATISVPLKCLHVVRNPFDMVAMEPSLENAFEENVSVIRALRDALGEDLLDVYYEDLLADPKNQLQRILEFLGLDADDSYLDMTRKYLRDAPRQRRFEVIWSEESRRGLQEVVDRHDCYHRYSPGESLTSEKPPAFKHPRANREFIVSGRNIGPDRDAPVALYNRYHGFGGNIKAAYAFVWGMYSPLYGGRGYHRHNSLSPDQVALLRKHGVFLYIPMSNHFFSLEDYKQSRELLERYHMDGNGVICVNDELAEAIRNDYPKYKLEASMIKNIKTHEEIGKAFRLYDLVTLRMALNDDEVFLQSLPQKERIVLFGNSKCEYHCEMNCLLPFSKRLKADKDSPLVCWRREKGLPIAAYMEFDLDDSRFSGFTTFKLEPEYVNFAVGR